MPRISEETRRRGEDAIRAAMDRLLGGELPPGRKPDIKSLAAEAGISRQLFYSRDKGVTPGLYQHLAQEFDRRSAARRELGEAADPRQAQVERLHAANADLKRRLAEREAEVAELKEFKQQAASRIAAQHAEIQRLRREASTPNLHRLPSSV
ncbi:hypothetical protein OIE71_06205 [Streptomyces sp. NBC_01725]|uniref:hypothetical protein n=1 Tax=Streptomyces sp. NBC_01725 TaxID=2975923 RepID=UPI002E2D4638|nr:hypothetical protein [Streptomyces sp. NBC_01725]